MTDQQLLAALKVFAFLAAGMLVIYHYPWIMGNTMP